MGAIAGFALAACATYQMPIVVSPPVKVGDTFGYLRTNWDGSNPEQIFIHITAPNVLAVMKRTDKCADATLTTAEYSLDHREAYRITNGRLGEDGRHMAQSVLVKNLDTRTINVRYDVVDKPNPDLIMKGADAPWRLYDLDLAELVLFGPKGDTAKGDLSFGMAMAWSGADAPSFQVLGSAVAIYESSTLSTSHSPAYHDYRISGPALPGGGLLRLDGTEGFVLAAEFVRPNHPGYKDFRLEFVDRIAGEKAWQLLLASHWDGCQTE